MGQLAGRQQAELPRRQQAVIFSSPHLNAIMWFIHVYVSSHTGPCKGAAGRQQAGLPLVSHYVVQPPDILLGE